MDSNHFPKILVITENPPRENSLGFGRTIANILKDYPLDRILYYVPEYDYSDANFKVIQSQYLTFGFRKKKTNQPRWWAPIVNRILDFYMHSFQSLRIPGKQLSVIREFNADVILLVPMVYDTLLEGNRIGKLTRKPVFIYLMDDTLEASGWHFGGRRYSIIKRTLAGASGWIMISKYLTETLAERYNITPRDSMVLHNPVESDKAISIYTSILRSKFVIAYAGSIHSFHDALFKVAEAVFELQNEGVEVELKVYTREDFWTQCEPLFNKWNVVNGGFVSYGQLFKTLNESNLLLCTTSFSRNYFKLVSTSVFTKLTDYMAAGRLVWSYGPSYSANNKYLEENRLGVVSSEEDIPGLKKFIRARVENKDNDIQLIERQTQYILEEGNISTLTTRLNDFLFRNANHVSKKKS